MNNSREKTGEVGKAASRSLAELERSLGVRFSRSGLLAQAMAHTSYANEQAPDSTDGQDNERLEFLGDAVLALVTSQHLYRLLPHASEGDLTVIRAGLVRESTLARWARQLQLGRFVKLGRGEALSGGHERDALLAQTFEAVLGAIYLERGLRRASAFLAPFLTAELGSAPAVQPTLDAKSRLQHVTQARFDTVPSYTVVDMSGPGHGPVFTVEVAVGPNIKARGVGRNKQAAEQAAAAAALESLERSSPQER